MCVEALPAHLRRLLAALQTRRDTVIEVDERQATVWRQVLARCAAHVFFLLGPWVQDDLGTGPRRLQLEGRLNARHGKGVRDQPV